MVDCVYFESRGDGAQTHICQLHEQCKLAGEGRKYASCNKCNDALSLADNKFPNEWVDPLYIIDRFKHKTDSLRNLLAGMPAFLFCGGPSALEFPLEDLDRNISDTLIRDEMPALLDRLHGLNNISFVLAIGTEQHYSSILIRICEHVESIT